MESINWALVASIALAVISSAVALGLFQVAGKALVKFVKPKMSTTQWQLVVNGAHAAYFIVERISRTSAWKGDDKLAEGLRQMVTILRRDLTPEEKQLATKVMNNLAHSQKINR